MIDGTSAQIAQSVPATSADASAPRGIGAVPRCREPACGLSPPRQSRNCGYSLSLRVSGLNVSRHEMHRHGRFTPPCKRGESTFTPSLSAALPPLFRVKIRKLRSEEKRKNGLPSHCLFPCGCSSRLGNGQDGRGCGRWAAVWSVWAGLDLRGLLGGPEAYAARCFVGGPRRRLPAHVSSQRARGALRWQLAGWGRCSREAARLAPGGALCKRVEALRPRPGLCGCTAGGVPQAGNRLLMLRGWSWGADGSETDRAWH